MGEEAAERNSVSLRNIAEQHYADNVYAAQQEYYDKLEPYWEKVKRGLLSYEEYCNIGQLGDPARECLIRIDEAELIYNSEK